MDAYPNDYVFHNLPLVVLSGIDSPQLESVPPVHDVLPGQTATTISSEIPSLTDKRAQQLLQEFMNVDGRDAAWNPRLGNRRNNLIGFRFRAAGRDYILPPRKADPPVSDVSPPGSPIATPASSWVLHSPISPLSPQSPIYPDGVIAPSWVAKHQHYIPSVFVSFFEFTSDPTRNTLHDNQLKTEIIKLKEQIRNSRYSTRYAVVLLSDKTILEAPDIEERLAALRRATGLDLKNSLFFLPPNTSQVELRSFVVSVLTALQPVCIEYYRDISKHTRRKRAKGNIPPPTAPPTRGTSQTLSYQGWNVRWDFKQGVFAEFRQEMDAAQRHYNTALEGLFGPDGVFETTASWSPRWDEIRLLADTIALRNIRCLLWNNSTTTAVQVWSSFKSRLQDLIDRRGKGTSNYGWEAWESRWAKIMAQLIQRAELPVFRVVKPHPESDPLVDNINALFSPPDKNFPVGERFSPWQYLHHAGYWYKLSAEHAKKRMMLARDMPEEDRTPPGMSPATQVSHRNQVYDHYLVPEPHIEYPLPGAGEGFNHWQDIVSKLTSASFEYDARGQQRKVEQVQLEVAKMLLSAEKYEEAFKTLRPLWASSTWRKEKWWNLASEVTWALHECARRIHNAETYVATEWELYSEVFTRKPRYRHDLMACLDSFHSNENPKPNVKVTSPDVVSCLSASFTFSESEGNVGEPLAAQIALTSTARPGAAPIVLSSLGFQFSGGLSEIQLTHKPGPKLDDNSKGSSCLFQITLEETSSTEQRPRWHGSSDLTIHSGQTKVFAFPLVFREAGDVEVARSRLQISTDRFDLTYSNFESEINVLPTWWIQAGTRIRGRKLARDSGTAIKILPKPPKMEIRFPNLLDQYYTDEPIKLDIEISNKEEETTEAVLEVRLLGRSKDTLEFSWTCDGSSTEPPSTSTEDEISEVDLPGHVVGQLAQGEKRTQSIQFMAPSESSDYALEVKVLYHLLSDRDIPISKTLIADLIFAAPLEANYEFLPRAHPDPWPSYFELQEDEPPETALPSAFGIAHRWLLKAKVASFADEMLFIQDVTIDIHTVHGGAICAVTKEFDVKETPLNPECLDERSFCLDTRKVKLEERRNTAVDMNLVITWRRDFDGAPSINTTLPIPRINVPASEPRVLASAMASKTIPTLIHLDYTFENPTMHFLTFELSMEASEEFGFSGPKLRVLNLLPMSRQIVRYNILPVVRGAWITPQLRVLDRYFNKTLKVHATGDLRPDKKDISIWVDAEDDD